MNLDDALASLGLRDERAPEEAAALTAAFRVEQHLSRYRFCAQGLRGNAMIVALDGIILMNRDDDDGQPVESTEVGLGESFGEIALVARLPATFTAVAASTVTVARLDAEGFVQLHAGAPRAARALKRLIARQLARELQLRNRLLRARIRRELTIHPGSNTA